MLDVINISCPSAFMRLGTIDDLSADIPAGHSRSLSLSPTLLPSHSEPLLSPASEMRRLCSSQRAMSYLDFSVDERNLMSPEYDSGDPNQSVRYMKAAKVNNTELTSIYMSESKTFQFCMIPMIVLQCIFANPWPFGLIVFIWTPFSKSSLVRCA